MSARMKRLALVLLAVAVWAGEAFREGEAPGEPQGRGQGSGVGGQACRACEAPAEAHQGWASHPWHPRGEALPSLSPVPCPLSPIHSLLLTPNSLLLSDSSVDSGRTALDHWWRYPWYDSQTDGIRRIDVREPYDWNFPKLSWPNIPWPATALEWIAWLLLLATLAAITYLLIRAYLGRRKAAQVEESPAPAAKPEDIAARIEALPFPMRRHDGDFLAEARRNYEEANFAEAIVYLFSYQLLELDRNQLIRLARGKTNRQYLRQLVPRRPMRALLEQTMVAFEDVFFGNHPLERARFEACWSRLDEFQLLVKAGVS